MNVVDMYIKVLRESVGVQVQNCLALKQFYLVEIRIRGGHT